MNTLNYLFDNYPTLFFILFYVVSISLSLILIKLTTKYPNLFFKIFVVGVIIGTILLFILKLAIIAIAIIIFFFVTLVKLNNN